MNTERFNSEDVSNRQMELALDEILREEHDAHRPSMSPPAGRRFWPAALVVLGAAVTLTIAGLSDRLPTETSPGVRPESQGRQELQNPVTVYNAEEIRALPKNTDNVRGEGLGDDDVQALARLPELRRLDLGIRRQRRPCISPAGMQAIGKLTTLEELHLDRQPEIGDGLKHLGALRRLRVLSLAHSTVPGPSLAILRKLPELVELDLGGCRYIRDADIEHVIAIPTLRNLSLQSLAWLCEPALRSLSKLRELRILDLGDVSGRTTWLDGKKRQDGCSTGVTDPVLVEVGKLPNLRQLTLIAAEGFSNEGLGALRELKNLNRLNLRWCRQVTDEGLRNLPVGLQDLKLNGTAVRGLAFDRFEQLRILDLSSCQNIDDSSLEALARGPVRRTLQQLKLSDVQGLQTEALGHIAKLTALAQLGLTSNRWLTDECFASLSPLRGSLRRLDLSANTHLDGVCLDHFHGFERLEHLLVTSIDVEGEPAKRLRDRHPKLNIEKVAKNRGGSLGGRGIRIGR